MCLNHINHADYRKQVDKNDALMLQMCEGCGHEWAEMKHKRKLTLAYRLMLAKMLGDKK